MIEPHQNHEHGKKTDNNYFFHSESMVKIDIGNIFVQKCKILSETENPVRINRFVAFLFIILFRVSSLQAQTIPIDTTEILRQLPLLADSLGIPDSVITNPEYRDLVVDSLLHVFRPATTMPDSVGLADTTRTSKQMPPAKGDVETTVDYKARDSIYFDLKNQKMYLYGESKIDYGNISLQGERIELDWVNNTIQANYVIDTAGKKIGKPVFSEAGQTYVTDDMTYNFKSRKAIINGIITEQDGAIMHGEKVKKNERDEMFIRHAKYTTCDHAEENYDGFDPNSPESYILFSLYQNAFLENSLSLAQNVEDQFQNRVGRRSRGVKSAGFLVLWKTSMPSILVETGFLSNAKEERDLNDKLQQEYIASGIFRAFRDYKKQLEAQ